MINKKIIILIITLLLIKSALAENCYSDFDLVTPIEFKYHTKIGSEPGPTDCIIGSNMENGILHVKTNSDLPGCKAFAYSQGIPYPFFYYNPTTGDISCIMAQKDPQGGIILNDNGFYYIETACPAELDLYDPFGYINETENYDIYTSYQYPSHLCLSTKDYGDVANGYCYSNAKDADCRLGQYDDEQITTNDDLCQYSGLKSYATILLSTMTNPLAPVYASVFRFKDKYEGNNHNCYIESCSLTAANCPEDETPCDENHYSYLNIKTYFPGRDKIITLTSLGQEVNLDCTDTALFGANGCTKGELHENLPVTSGESTIEYCFRSFCDGSAGWINTDNTQQPTNSCADICGLEKADECSTGSCITTDESGTKLVCRYDITCKTYRGGYDFEEEDFEPATILDLESQYFSYAKLCGRENIYFQVENSNQLKYFDAEGEVKTATCSANCPFGTVFNPSLGYCSSPEGQYLLNGNFVSCPLGTYYETQGDDDPSNDLCTCPEGTHYNLFRNACFNINEIINEPVCETNFCVLMLEYNAVIAYAEIEKVPLCDIGFVNSLTPNEQGVYECITGSINDPHICDYRKGEALSPDGCVQFFDSCTKSEYYDFSTGECKTIDSLNCQSYEYYDTTLKTCKTIIYSDVDCVAGYKYNMIDGVCLTKIDAVDCTKYGNGQTIKPGVNNYCEGGYSDLLVMNGGWVGIEEKCPMPGTILIEENNVKTCYYYPDWPNLPCSRTGCNLRTDYIAGDDWSCDPKIGAVLKNPSIITKSNTQSMLTPLLAYGIQERAFSSKTTFYTIESCGCKAQEESMSDLQCPSYIPPKTAPEIVCNCIPDKRLFKETKWDETFTHYDEITNTRCDRLQLTTCYWNYNEQIELPEFHKPGIDEKEVWCTNVKDGSYCTFESNTVIKFNFNITSLIDILFFSYNKGKQVPIEMTYFNRGSEIRNDNGTPSGTIKLLTGESVRRTFTMPSVSALESISITDASISVFCSGNGAASIKINQENVGIITCDEKPSWQSIEFRIQNNLETGDNEIDITALSDVHIGVDISTEFPFYSSTNELIQCGLDNDSPTEETIFESNNIQNYFIKNSAIIIISQGKLIDLTNEIEITLDGQIGEINDILAFTGYYFIASKNGLFQVSQTATSMIRTGEYLKVFLMNDKLIGANSQGLDVIAGNKVDFNLIDVTYEKDYAFINTEQGIYYWDGATKTLLENSQGVTFFKSVNWLSNDNQDLIGYQGNRLYVWVKIIDGFTKKSLGVINNLKSMLITDINLDGEQEIIINNQSPYWFKKDNTFIISEIKPLSISNELSNSSPESWNSSPYSLYTLTKDSKKLIKISAPKAECPGTKGSIMTRLVYGEKNPVAIPDFLFPNINVISESVYASNSINNLNQSPLSRNLYCNEPYYFKMTLVQEEKPEFWRDSFSMTMLFNEAPIYCSTFSECTNDPENNIYCGTKDIPYNQSSGPVTIYFKCQMPNCHWGLPVQENFKICTRTSAYEYDNCYALETIKGLIGQTDGIKGELTTKNFIVGNKFDIKGYLWDSDEYYNLLSGFYLKPKDANGPRYCVNDSLINVNRADEKGLEQLLIKDCGLPKGDYDAYVYAENYFDKKIDTISVEGACNEAADCNDDNDCTDDTCSAEGLCDHTIKTNGLYGTQYCYEGLEVECYEPSHCGASTTCFLKTCNNNICGQSPIATTCGDGKCCGSETTANCCVDCGCPSGQTCQSGSCIASCTNCPSGCPAYCSGTLYYAQGTCDCSTCMPGASNSIVPSTECGKTGCNGLTCTADAYTCTTDICSGGVCTHTNTCSGQYNICCGLNSGCSGAKPSDLNKCCYLDSDLGWICI